jgi:nitrogen regulatory protein PII
MKMLMIVFRDSIEEDVKALLARQHVRAFTEMHDVIGTGEAGAAFHSLS